MKKLHSWNAIAALLLGMAAVLFAGVASADPPSRVARLGYISGPVSFSPAGSDEWVLATLNRPLIAGDRLWVEKGSRAELQIGASVIHIGGGTNLTLLNLTDNVAQLQVTQGTVRARVRRLGPREVVEIDTPNLAYVLRKPGAYRVDVDPSGTSTAVSTRSGLGEVYGEGTAYTIDAGQAYRFGGTDLRDSQYVQAPADPFENWVVERDRRVDRSISARYVSPSVIGYEDLDEHGTWRAAEGYGNVWVPNRVRAGWSPYRDGHWSWVEPWGWTWVDDAPWGFAPSHYGRWANLHGTWAWVPGPVRTQAVYAPALVAFVGGSNFRLSISSGNVGGVAWFPLAPREVYRPSYPVSRNYFNNVNTSNTTVNNTHITNVYNTRNVTNVTNVTYVNRTVAGAVTAVPATAFVQSQPVAKAAVQVRKEAIAKAPVTAVATVAPQKTSVHGGAAPGAKPPAEALARPVVAKEAPPPAPASFASKQSALAANPGKPADPKAAPTAKQSAPAAPAPAVKVVSTTQPTAAPPKGPEKGTPPALQKGAPSVEASKEAQPPEAQKGAPPAEAQKGPPPAPAPKPPAQPKPQKAPEKGEAPKGSQAPSAPKAPESPKGASPAEAQKGTPAPKAPAPAESQKGPEKGEASKGPQPASAPQAPEPPKSAEPPKAPAPPAPPKAAKPAVTVPQPPDAKASVREVEKAAPPPISVPKPEAPKAPAVSAPTPPKAAPREIEKAAPPPVSAPKSPEAPKPPSPVSAPKPPAAKPAAPPQEADSAPPRKSEAKGGDRRGDRKGDDDEKPLK